MIRTILLASTALLLRRRCDFRASGLGTEKMKKENKKLQVTYRQKKNLTAMNTGGNVIMTQIKKN